MAPPAPRPSFDSPSPDWPRPGDANWGAMTSPNGEVALKRNQSEGGGSESLEGEGPMPAGGVTWPVTSQRLTWWPLTTGSRPREAFPVHAAFHDLASPLPPLSPPPFTSFILDFPFLAPLIRSFLLSFFLSFYPPPFASIFSLSLSLL